MTVNHGVPGSSPGGGATLDKPSEMMAFSLSISELGFSCQRINTLFSIHFTSDIHFQ